MAEIKNKFKKLGVDIDDIVIDPDTTDKVKGVMEDITNKIKNGELPTKIKDELTFENFLKTSFRVPGVKVNREKFLRKELIKYYPEEIIEKAIESNPAKAGIPVEFINKLSMQVINYETTKVTAASALTGFPGGIAAVPAVTVDITFYFAMILRTAQELAFLYGFGDFNLKEEDIDTETLHTLLIFIGVMFGVEGAATVLNEFAEVLSKHIAKELARKALTKGVVYPIVKAAAKKLGIKMTKQIFADTVANAVPILGGVLSGALSFAMFKPNCKRLRKNLMTYNLCDPKFYGTKEIEPYVEPVSPINKIKSGIKSIQITGAGTLNIPIDYEKGKTPDFKGLALPKEALTYGTGNESFSGFFIAFPVTEEMSMPFDDTQSIIDALHDSMPDNAGIIEVESGFTGSGCPYVYHIMKRGHGDSEISAGIVYTLNYNIRLKDGIAFVNGAYSERGITGSREAAVFALAHAANLISTDSLEGWSFDPYDPDFTKGFLMNISEKEEVDGTFPDHPLSRVRSFVKFLEEAN